MGNTPELLKYSAAGKQVVCSHCGNTDFTCREILMNTRGATFMKLDWLNKSAVALTCSKCNRIEWYGETPTPID